jgi:hypothetical protein
MSDSTQVRVEIQEKSRRALYFAADGKIVSESEHVQTQTHAVLLHRRDGRIPATDLRAFVATLDTLGVPDDTMVAVSGSGGFSLSAQWSMEKSLTSPEKEPS